MLELDEPVRQYGYVQEVLFVGQCFTLRGRISFGRILGAREARVGNKGRDWRLPAWPTLVQVRLGCRSSRDNNISSRLR